MAVIGRNAETVFQVTKFTGLNESPSGDGGLAPGQGAEARNFRVTAEGCLQLRPGTRTLWRFDGPVEGIWAGTVGGNAVRLAAAEGKLWKLLAPGEKVSLGSVGPGKCGFFTFDGALYILTPKRYLVWTGYGQVTDVAGYRPAVVTACPPEGGGVALEQVNKLTGARRGFFSPDGTAKTFQLPEGELTAADYVIRRDTGEHLPFTAELGEGTVTLETPPPQGVNTLEIGWTKGSGDRGTVVGMTRAELFSGQTDNRVMLYGDGSNRVLYSGIDREGRPDPTYFPDLNVMEAGSDKTPVTGIIRHFTRLLIFKPDGAWSVQAGTAQTASGETAAFYLLPIQREMGCGYLGMVSLVDNDPRTVWAGGVYRWRSASGYLTLDERAAQRISGRVEASLEEMDLSEGVVFDDQARREWYLCVGDAALVHNYGVDAWYRYEGFPARCFGVLDGVLHYGTEDGRLVRVSRDYRSDDGRPIDALWRSGSLAFGKPERGKFGKWLWVSLKPESGGALEVTTRTDRQGECPAEWVRASLMSYRNASFRHWSYAVNRRPRPKRVRLPVKKAGYEQIVLMSRCAGETATVLGLEGTVRYGRMTK